MLQNVKCSFSYLSYRQDLSMLEKRPLPAPTSPNMSSTWRFLGSWREEYSVSRFPGRVNNSWKFPSLSWPSTGFWSGQWFLTKTPCWQFGERIFEKEFCRALSITLSLVIGPRRVEKGGGVRIFESRPLVWLLGGGYWLKKVWIPSSFSAACLNSTSPSLEANKSRALSWASRRSRGSSRCLWPADQSANRLDQALLSCDILLW